MTARRGRARGIAALLILLVGWPISARADDEPDHRWGVSLWGLSYHFDEAIDFEEVNVGLGLRYYATRLVFVQVDALRNSNGGIAVPVTAALDFRLASLGSSCALHAVAAGTVVYYQNERTNQNYVRAGPVPGVTLGCGRVKTNAIVVFRRARQPVTAIVTSITFMLG
jgi:hypothetical protein